MPSVIADPSSTINGFDTEGRRRVASIVLDNAFSRTQEPGKFPGLEPPAPIVLVDVFPRRRPHLNRIREEAELDAKDEPMLASFLCSVVLNHRCLEDALTFILASKLGSSTVSALTLR